MFFMKTTWMIFLLLFSLVRTGLALEPLQPSACKVEKLAGIQAQKVDDWQFAIEKEAKRKAEKEAIEDAFGVKIDSHSLYFYGTKND